MHRGATRARGGDHFLETGRITGDAAAHVHEHRHTTLRGHVENHRQFGIVHGLAEVVEKEADTRKRGATPTS